MSAHKNLRRVISHCTLQTNYQHNHDRFGNFRHDDNTAHMLQSRDDQGSTMSLCTSDLYLNKKGKHLKFPSLPFGIFKLKQDHSAERSEIIGIGDHNFGDAVEEVFTSDFSKIKRIDECLIKQRSTWKTRLSIKSRQSKKRKAASFDAEKIPKAKSIHIEVTLLNVLQCKESSAAFRMFLKMEFSDENLDFWIEVETYRKSNKYLKTASKIYYKYIVDEAPRQINIASDVKTRIQRRLKTATARIFDEAQGDIFKLMEGDSFRRFAAAGHIHEILRNTDTKNRRRTL